MVQEVGKEQKEQRGEQVCGEGGGGSVDLRCDKKKKKEKKSAP